MANNNGWLIKTVSIIASIIIGVLVFMGNVVKENRNTAVKEHREMRKEYTEEISEIKSTATRIDTRQEVLIDTVQKIEAKL